jgi:hypothetical protein
VRQGQLRRASRRPTPPPDARAAPALRSERSTLWPVLRVSRKRGRDRFLAAGWPGRSESSVNQIVRKPQGPRTFASAKNGALKGSAVAGSGIQHTGTSNSAHTIRHRPRSFGSGRSDSAHTIEPRRRVSTFWIWEVRECSHVTRPRAVRNAAVPFSAQFFRRTPLSRVVRRRQAQHPAVGVQQPAAVVVDKHRDIFRLQCRR